MIFPLIALTMGALSGLHCAGMCGPLLLAMPFGRSSRVETVYGLLIYNFSKAGSYALLGALAGFTGDLLFTSGNQNSLSIFAGLLILFLTLVPALQGYFNMPVYRVVQKVKELFGAALKRKGFLTLPLLGMLNGLLPCGMVYMALVPAVACGNMQDAALFMFIFGIGTVPVLVSVVLLGNYVRTLKKNWFRKMIPVMMSGIGLLLIFRGLQLGIPYLSPTVQECGHEGHEGKIVCSPQR